MELLFHCTFVHQSKQYIITLTEMLEYIKTILLKVSFDKKLFEKELRKAFNVLVPEEIKQLKNWCYEMFSEMYGLILNRVFSRAQV